jgi:hypothetical protein
MPKSCQLPPAEARGKPKRARPASVTVPAPAVKTAPPCRPGAASAMGLRTAPRRMRGTTAGSAPAHRHPVTRVKHLGHGSETASA